MKPTYSSALSAFVLAAAAQADMHHVPDPYPNIQAAVDAADPGDEVVIAAGTYSGAGNINVDFGGMDITVRSADGPGTVTIDCQGAGRAFIFQGGETAAAVLMDLTIVNGYAEAGGGAVAIAGASPTIQGCHFENNASYTATGEFPTGSGGAIHSAGGSPTIDGCTFTDNTAGFDTSAIGTGFGGAIFMFLGGGTVTDCEFTGNLADGPGGFGNGIGGGAFVLFANPNLDGCAFNGNSAVIAGGGVWLQGTATADIGNSTFDSNTAQSGGGLALFEGAATVHDSTFTNNSVASADPLVQQQIGGGAIGSADTATITISDCSFSGNSSADGVGGAVSSIGGSTATIENCEFTDNSAATTGGAVHNGAAPGSEDPDLESPSTMTMTDCCLTSNYSEGGGGGASNQHGSTISVLACDFLGNSSFTATGGFPTGSGGTIHAAGSSSTIAGCNFTDNTAGFASSAGGTGFGGGIFMFLGGGSMSGCTFTGNVADGPGGFGNGIGGGTFVLFASPNVDGCAFNGNSAVIAGGGLWLQGTATTDIGNSSFDGNTAQSGGGLALFEGAATVHDSTFTDNSVASADPLVQQQIGGGAIGSADTSTITISRCSFSSNTSADGVGGAVSSIGGSTATIENCEFRGGEPADITGYMKSTEQVPIMTNSESILQFGNNGYGKPATALNILRETILGRELFDFAFREYARRWKFKRPTPADFFRTMEEASGVDLDWFWRGWFYSTDHVDIGIQNVRLFKIDSGDPDESAERKRQEKDQRRPSLSEERNEPLEKRIDLFPGLKDFYNDYDDFDVTEDSRKAFQRMVDGLNAQEKQLLRRKTNFYVITFENVGGLVMPIIAEVRYTDGSHETLNIPAEIWRSNAKVISKLVITDKELDRIELDPRRQLADADASNNFYPPRLVPSRFRLFKDKSPKNPMQKAKDAKKKATDAKAGTAKPKADADPDTDKKSGEAP